MASNFVSDEAQRRRIRSFVLRNSRLTKAQKGALERYWDRYGVAKETPADVHTLFGNDAPTILEIGFGNGESLAETAARHPENNYLGVEVHQPGIGHLLAELHNRNINNVRIYCSDAVEILEDNIVDGTLDGIHLFFPDPWSKRRHHKRRLVSDEFMELMLKALKAKGYVHAATDWKDYANQIRRLFDENKSFLSRSGDNFYLARTKDRPLTKFEKRGLGLGHQVWDLVYTKVK